MNEVTQAKSELWYSRLEEYQTSGLSAKQWCSENNIKYSTFLYWSKKLSAAGTTEVASNSDDTVFAQLPSERELLTVYPSEAAPVVMFFGGVRIEISPDCPQPLLRSLVGVLRDYA